MCEAVTIATARVDSTRPKSQIQSEYKHTTEQTRGPVQRKQKRKEQIEGLRRSPWVCICEEPVDVEVIRFDLEFELHGNGLGVKSCATEGRAYMGSDLYFRVILAQTEPEILEEKHRRTLHHGDTPVSCRTKKPRMTQKVVTTNSVAKHTLAGIMYR